MPYCIVRDIVGDARAAQVTLISILQGVALALLLEGQDENIQLLIAGNRIEWTSVFLAVLMLVIIAGSTYVLLIEVLAFSWGFPIHQVLFWFTFASMEWLAAVSTDQPAATFAFIAAMGFIATAAFLFNYWHTKGGGRKKLDLYTSVPCATKILRMLPILNRLTRARVSDRHLLLALVLALLTVSSGVFAVMASAVDLEATVIGGSLVMVSYLSVTICITGTIDFKRHKRHQVMEMVKEHRALAARVARMTKQ